MIETQCLQEIRDWGVAERRLGGTGFGCFSEMGKPDRSYGIGFIAHTTWGLVDTIGLEPVRKLDISVTAFE